MDELSENQKKLKQEIERLENMIKERETSRFRATSTLVTDIVTSINDDKKIPLASIKGFIFSWMFPTAILVGGSIVTTFLIVFQSYLLVVQNGNIDRQNRLIAFEQTSSFREKLVQEPFGERIPEDPNLRFALYPRANPSTIEQLVLFGTEEPEVVSAALKPLLKDENSTVSSGAVFALHQLKAKVPSIKLDFSGSNLSGGNLNNATLGGLNFSHSNFRGCTLKNSILNRTTFDYCNLQFADLSESEIAMTSFKLSDLSWSNLHNIVVLNDVQTMAGANIYEISNPPQGFIETAIKLGAVNMTRSDWAAFKKELDELSGGSQFNREIFEKYLTERAGPTFDDWRKWLEAQPEHHP